MIENEIDLSSVINQLKEQVFLRIKESFIKYEEMGIKCKILCWRDDFIRLIKSDPFFSGKFINFEFKEFCEEFLKIFWNEVTYSALE